MSGCQRSKGSFEVDEVSNLKLRGNRATYGFWSDLGDQREYHETTNATLCLFTTLI